MKKKQRVWWTRIAMSALIGKIAYNDAIMSMRRE
jgi:hypothetical protein